MLIRLLLRVYEHVALSFTQIRTYLQLSNRIRKMCDDFDPENQQRKAIFQIALNQIYLVALNIPLLKLKHLVCHKCGGLSKNS